MTDRPQGIRLTRENRSAVIAWCGGEEWSDGVRLPGNTDHARYGQWIVREADGQFVVYPQELKPWQ